MSEDVEEDIFNGYGIKVKLNSDFNRIREVLTRIGIANNKNKTLTQSCHIFHKRGEYAIMHFLEMFLFDGKQANFNQQDEARRNRIVNILENWGLIERIDPFETDEKVAPFDAVTILSRKDVSENQWKLIPKYTLGKSND